MTCEVAANPVDVDALLALLLADDATTAAGTAIELVSRTQPIRGLAFRGRLYPGDVPLPTSEEIGEFGQVFVPLAPAVALICSGEGLSAPTATARLVGELLARRPGRHGETDAATRGRLDAAVAITQLAAANHRFGHDLRNRLCAIALNVQLLTMTIGSSLDEKAAKKLAAINDSIGQIQSLVDDFSRVTKQLSLGPAAAGPTGEPS